MKKFNCSKCILACVESLENKKKWFGRFERRLDSFIRNSKLTIPLFFLLLFVIFEITFSLWNFFSNIIDLGANYVFSLTWIENKFAIAVFGW